MGDIAILKEMFQDTAIVSLEECKHKKQVTLEEPGPPKYEVTLYEMPNENEVIIIKADAFKSPNTVFKGKHGECRRSDFVIIADWKNFKVIVFIEMKRRQAENSYIITQIKGSECFVAYCREIGRKFWNKPDFLSNYEYRFVSTRDISISKSSTRDKTKQQEINNTPEKMRKLSSRDYLQFYKLVYPDIYEYKNNRF
ncbi:hypothetical protein NG799_14040 [Laspinema sp. D1]|uniref:Type I restriction enzyme R protein N-terminal domain-containing protein n=1 Tax=Laspinema palackyanum D2a TaxID=2953684 RepID=A0ABT2MSF1_9CYAN|nr:hypothetical protein [Laspinema sp. D2a]